MSPALAWLLAMVWNRDYEDERDARFINDRVHGRVGFARIRAVLVDDSDRILSLSRLGRSRAPCGNS